MAPRPFSIVVAATCAAAVVAEPSQSAGRAKDDKSSATKSSVEGPHGSEAGNEEMRDFMNHLPGSVLKSATFPWKTNTAKLAENFPDTTIAGAGFIEDCDVSKCGGSDKNYYLQAVLREFTIKNSKNVETAPPGTYPNEFEAHKISDKDVTLLTRSLEAIPGAPSSPFGPDALGGDGTAGMLGPAVQMLPGETVSFFVKNNLDPSYQQNSQYVPSRDTYAQKAGNMVQAGSRTIISSLGNVPDDKLLETFTQFLPWEPTPAEKMIMDTENSPGWTTNHSFNIFNIHLHGMEVAPHLFHPMGTSDPKADWIDIEPTSKNGKQCYCYKFHISPKNSKGLFAYHTHRHGTESVATWSGMFGALMTDNYLLPSQAPTAPGLETPEPATNPATSQMYQLVQMAQKFKIPFTDDDVIPFVVYNTMWKFRSESQTDPTSDQPFPSKRSDEASKVEINGFLQNQIPTTQVNPFLTNNEYQPTFKATAGHLTMFRMLCISTQYLCGFQVTDSRGKAVPFYITSSDGITHTSPDFYDTTPVNTAAIGLSVVELMGKIGNTMRMRGRYSEGKIEMLAKKLQSLQPQTNAYLQLGGGMRQDILIQFVHEGTYTISQAGYPGFNPYQVLATVKVAASPYCGAGWSSCGTADLSTFNFGPAARDVLKDMQRPVASHLGLDFKQKLNRTRSPWVQWGMADRQGTAFEPFHVDHTDMEATGGTCAVWTVRSRDVIFHPFHIHVNPFIVMDVKMDPPADSDLADSAALAQNLLTSAAFYSNSLTSHWRDTVMIPPMGSVTLKQCFDAGPAADKFGTQLERFAGKFVFHCHFLTHSDTGLMHNIMLTSGDAIKKPAEGSMPVTAIGDATSCPASDPCGLGAAAGCVKCPKGATVKGCSCLPSEPAALQGKYTDAGPVGVAALGGLSATAAAALAVAAAAASSLITAAVLRRGRRGAAVACATEEPEAELAAVSGE